MLFPIYARVITDIVQPACNGKTQIVIARAGHCVKVISATVDGKYVVRHPNDTCYPPISIMRPEEIQFGT